MSSGAASRGAVLTCLLLLACASPAGPTPSSGEEPLFPADYADRYVEVRDCRKSGDHELDFVRVLSAESALEPYEARMSPFPDGAVVLKEQFDAGDDSCSGPIVEWTLMRKHGSATDRLGWDWQRVGADRRVRESNGARCVTCHASCSGPPDVGYDSTCAEPP